MPRENEGRCAVEESGCPREPHELETVGSNPTRAIENLRERIRDLCKAWGRSSDAQSARLSGEKGPVRVRSSPFHGGRGVTARIQGCEPCGVGSSPTGYPFAYCAVAFVRAGPRRAELTRSAGFAEARILAEKTPNAAPANCPGPTTCPTALRGVGHSAVARAVLRQRHPRADAEHRRAQRAVTPSLHSCGGSTPPVRISPNERLGPVAGGQQVHFAPWW
jgi:hypothetical protein